MARWKDGQTLFDRILSATVRGLKSTTAVDWQLRVKSKKCDIGLIKNYCITVSMQKLSSIHIFIQQILGSHKLNDHAHFWPGPLKNHWNNFLLSWICMIMQKISPFHQYILEKQPILESYDQTGHAHRKNFWLTFNLCVFVSTCRKLGYFVDLFWRYGWLKILQSHWLRTFLPISQELEFSQIWDLCRNTANVKNFHYKTNSLKINDTIFQY